MDQYQCSTCNYVGSAHEIACGDFRSCGNFVKAKFEESLNDVLESARDLILNQGDPRMIHLLDAREIVETVAIRSPAMIAGVASGSSTRRKVCRRRFDSWCRTTYLSSSITGISLNPALTGFLFV